LANIPMMLNKETSSPQHRSARQFSAMGLFSGVRRGYLAWAQQMMRTLCMNGFGSEVSNYLRMGSNPSPAAGVQTFLNWAEDHPERCGEPALSGVVLAFSSMFPCEE
jgi:hypothetical protein